MEHDHDLALEAFSGTTEKSRDLAGLYNIDIRRDFDFLTDFAASVHAQIATHDVFVGLILGGIASHRTVFLYDEEKNASPLSLLNQGEETCLVYKTLLVEFAGVPIGSQLQKLRRASSHLTLWGY